MGQRGKSNRFLADKSHADKVQRAGTDERRERYEQLLTSIANLKFPTDGSIVTIDLSGRSEEEQRFFEGAALRAGKPGKAPVTGKRFDDKLRAMTVQAWPEIWAVDAEPPPVIAVERMRGYLRRCWDSHAPREQMWHIHRAIEYCQTSRILGDGAVKALHRSAIEAISEQNTRQLHELNLSLQIRTQDLLDRVPPINKELEDALEHLRAMASGKIKRRRPLHCPADGCEEPYFFSWQKGQKYCPTHQMASPDGKARYRRSKRNSYHANKDTWPSQAKRRKRSPR
jgi:hypothetical protein